MSYNRPAHNKPRAKMASVQARISRYHFALRRDSHGTTAEIVAMAQISSVVR